MITAAAARRHLEALAAEPRPAGGEAEARARAYCAGVLRDAGLEVIEEPFSYSAFPGRWATPVFGVFAVYGLATVAIIAGSGQPKLALFVWVQLLVLMGFTGFWLARRGVLGLGGMRRDAVNLVARRGEPRVWLMAHLDSKSQPIPMLVRIAGISATVLVWLAAAGLALAQANGGDVAMWWPWVGGLGVVAGIPIVASTVGSHSPGAVDDASGVVAVLLAAEWLAGGSGARADGASGGPADGNRDGDAGHPFGVVLTSAEELGLAGARSWVRGRPAGTAINCDGVDDAGMLTAMYSGRAPSRLLNAFRAAAAEQGTGTSSGSRTHRVLPGVLVDGVALADAGWEVVTISRGTIATLRRIHTREDSLDRMTGAGIPAAARVIGRMARALAG